MATIHQRPFGWLWHWDTGPGWVRDGSEIAKLAQAGMKVLRVQCQDDGPIPVDQVREWRAAGVQVWLAIGHVDGRDPVELAQWMKNEQLRFLAEGTSINGWDCNFEEDVRAMDAATNGQWSVKFCAEFRRLMPTMPAHLDTYYGSAAASPGINLSAYLAKGFRYTIQTYWGQEGLWNDPCTRIVGWTAGATPSIPKSIVKPLHRISPNTAGQLPNWQEVFKDWQWSGLKGGGWYYIDGGDFDLLGWLVKESIKLRVCY